MELKKILNGKNNVMINKVRLVVKGYS